MPIEVVDPPLPNRDRLREWLIAQSGKPYLWTSKGERQMVKGVGLVECYDCSGLVTVGLRAVGHPPVCIRLGCDARGKTFTGYHNAQRLFDDFEATTHPKALDLAFYGWDRRHVDHVMFLWHDGRVYGSCGGNSDSTDPSVSLSKGQGVKFRASAHYRPDFLGFRRLPF